MATISLVTVGAKITATLMNLVIAAINGGGHVWADSSARNAQTGMTVGAKGTQTDTGATYRYDGSAWKVWEAAPTTYSPTLTGFGGTTPTTVASYSVTGGRYIVDIAVTFVSGTTLSTHPYATLPAATAASYLQDAMLGRAYLLVAGNNYPASTLRYTSTSLITAYPETASGTYIGVASVSSSVPATWATGSIWRVHAEYLPA